jgi:hypothetical protein
VEDFGVSLLLKESPPVLPCFKFRGGKGPERLLVGGSEGVHRFRSGGGRWFVPGVGPWGHRQEDGKKEASGEKKWFAEGWRMEHDGPVR